MEDEKSISYKSISAVVGINLGILLVYSLYPLVTMIKANVGAGVGYLGVMAMIIVLHIVVLAIVSIAFLIAGRSQLAQASFLSLLLVALIGPGACFGVAAITAK